MEAHRLKLELIDRGFDYEVTCPVEEVLEEVSLRCDVGPLLLEIRRRRPEEPGSCRRKPRRPRKCHTHM